MLDDIAVPSPGVKADDPSAASNTHTWKFFADQINATWRKGAADFIRCGQLLNDAKAELQTDAFSAMVKSKLAFDRSVGVKLMKIADKSALCAQAHNLPPCWTTLYELAQLDDDILKAKLADGTIHPGMQRKDARALRCPKPRAETEASTNKGELLAAWKAATKDLRRRFLDAIGADALCEALSIPLCAELRRRVGSRQKAAASPLEEVIAKAIRQALSLQKASEKAWDEPAPGVAAALNVINSKLKAAGLDLNHVTIVVDASLRLAAEVANSAENSHGNEQQEAPAK